MKTLLYIALGLGAIALGYFIVSNLMSSSTDTQSQPTSLGDGVSAAAVKTASGGGSSNNANNTQTIVPNGYGVSTDNTNPLGTSYGDLVNNSAGNSAGW